MRNTPMPSAVEPQNFIRASAKAAGTLISMVMITTTVDTIAEFLKNVGHFPNLKPMKMSSVEAAKQFEDKSIDMVFLDGGHRYQDVKEDIEAWLPKAKKLICGHDYNFIPVQEAVTEKFGIPDSAESIWINRIKE